MPKAGMKKDDGYAAKMAQLKRADGRGDGWTLDEHLAEHRRLPSRVKFSQEVDGSLSVSHAVVGRWKGWVGLALLPLPGAALLALGFWPVIRENAVMLYGGLAVMAALSLLALSKITAVSRVRLNGAGCLARSWPPGVAPGGSARVVVSLDNVRRFKVGKTQYRSRVVYELHLHTRAGEQHTLIPRIPLKRDAYLMAMLLIDHVKRLRQGEEQ